MEEDRKEEEVVEEEKETTKEEKEESVEEKKEEPVEEEKEELEDTQVIRKQEPPKKKKTGVKVVVVILILILIAILCYAAFMNFKPTKKVVKNESKEYESELRLSGNGLEDFDLYFMKLENNKKNSVYSPLSIKYALAMLSEGAKGETKSQLDAVIGDYKAKSYPNNEHMSFANAMFIRDSYKNNIKIEYSDKLKEKYNAEVVLDPFTSPDNINNWVSNKTFNLINNLLSDVSDNDFFLINALAIDMDWNNQIHCALGHEDVPCLGNGTYSIYYDHERMSDDEKWAYGVTSYPYGSEEEFYNLEFNGQKKIKSSGVLADFNKYDIVKELGEENIRKTVTEEYKKWLDQDDTKKMREMNPGLVEERVSVAVDQYMEQLKSNYGKAANNTDFYVYDDKEVKVFAKDLKQYEGITLQYVGIMPKEDELSSYIEDVKSEDINNIIKGLKEVKIESFKEGVATRIHGSIPLFKYDYELKLVDDLNRLGITNIFTEKSDLSNMVEGPAIINKAIHKADIEFSNDGIKAAAATAMGGYGSTHGGFEYLYTIPVEDIDMTFNKPYMYIIRDKDSGEVWFVGTVYEPTKK